MRAVTAVFGRQKNRTIEIGVKFLYSPEITSIHHNIYRTMFTIRPSVPQDLDTLIRFQQAMAFETEGGMILAEEILRKGIQRLFDEPAKGAYWVAESQGQVVACILIITEWSDWRNGDVLWIHSLFVEMPFRNKGIFKQFYAHFKGMVEGSAHLRGLRLYVEKRNENAQRAYESVGMTKEHYEMYEWLK